MHFSKMQLVSHCYTAVLCEPISFIKCIVHMYTLHSLNSTSKDDTVDTIEVPQVCALALNNLPIVGRPTDLAFDGREAHCC